MLAIHQFFIALLSGCANAATLYASHYSGSILQLSLTNTSSTSYSLTSTASIRSGGTLPSWITYDGEGKALYVSDEKMSGSAQLNSFSIGASGALTATGQVTTPAGGVHNTLYGGSDGRGFIATAHYQSSTLSTFKLPLSSGAQAIQTLKYTMSGKGANPSRQDAPHPHSALTDPTGGYLLVPDLGADMIRIYSIDKTSGKLTECPNAKTPPNTGPRHGSFWLPSSAKSSRIRRGNAAAADGAVLFSANELGNSISAWSTSYASGGCLSLTLKQTLTPYANNASAPQGTKVGEVHVKGNFVYTSNRNDKKFSGSDSMTAYAISSSGGISFVENTSAFGTYPRTFDINKAGDLVAIGDQTTSNVAIVARDVTSGKLTGQVATLRILSAGTPENEDGLSAVVWAE